MAPAAAHGSLEAALSSRELYVHHHHVHHHSGSALTQCRSTECPAPLVTPGLVPGPALHSTSAEEMRSALTASAHYDRLYAASHFDMLIDEHGC